MSEPTVRAAGVDDVPALVELMSAFYAEAGFPLPVEAAARAFRDVIETPRHGRVWIVELDGEPAGHLVTTLCYGMEYGGLRAFIDDLFVRPEYRGRGLAAAAIAHARREALAEGVRALLVEVGPDNHQARRVYRRAGFVESGRLLLSQALAVPIHEADSGDGV